MALCVVGVALRAVGVASRGVSSPCVVTVQDGFCYFSLAFAECG